MSGSDNQLPAPSPSRRTYRSDVLSATFDHDLQEELKLVKPGQTLLPQSLGNARDGKQLFHWYRRLGSGPGSASASADIASDNGLAGEGEDISGQAFHTSDNEIAIGNSIMPVHHYLGTEWKDRIIDFQRPSHSDSTQQLSQPNELVTRLMSHQITGVTKGLVGINSPVLGYIHGDTMGLGKTLQVILVAMEAIRRQLVPKGPILVVTTKASISQWVMELKMHFRPEHRPRVIVIESKNRDISAKDIMDQSPNFVLVTYSKLLYEWKAKCDFLDFRRAVYISSGGRAAQNFSLKDLSEIARQSGLKLPPPTYPNTPIFSELWERLQIPWLVILDEAQVVQRPGGKTHAAIKDIYRSRVIATTGTPIPDRWYEIWGILDLMPGQHPFKQQAVFNRVFGGDVHNGVVDYPPLSKQDRLVRFLLGWVLSRPATVLNLPNVHCYTVLYEVPDDDAEMIMVCVRSFYAAVNMETSLEADENTTAIGQMTVAQQLELSPRLVAPSLINSLRSKITKSDVDALGSLSQPGPGDSIHSASIVNLTGQMIGTSAQQVAVVNARARIADMAARQHRSRRSGGGPDGQDDQSQQGRESISESSAQGRGDWLRELGSWLDDDVLNDKVMTVLRLISENWTKYPGEKTVVFSQFLKCLDIVAEGMRRDSRFKTRHLQPLFLNGTMSDSDRSENIATFKCSSDRPILITADAGGAALNLQEASIVIICEPWWSIGKRNQVIGRAARKGQTKEVKVFTLVCANSLASQVVMITAERKAQHTEKLIGAIQGPDDGQLVIPDILPGGVGGL